MRRAAALASTALLAFAASWLALAAIRPPGSAAPQPSPTPSTSAADPDRLMAQVAARLDEVGQVDDDLSDQATAVAKAELALSTARLDAEAAELALQEYTESTYPQELALADGDLAAAEAELRLLGDPSRRSDPPPRPDDRERPTASPSSDPPSLSRAKLARDLARAHREGLAARTRPRRIAELKKEIGRAQGEAKLKASALAQERSDLARLERQRKAAALNAEERAAMALLGEAAKPDADPAPRERAAALWRKAERRRAEARRADALERIRKALDERG